MMAGHIIDWMQAHELLWALPLAAVCLWLKWKAHRSGAFD